MERQGETIHPTKLAHIFDPQLLHALYSKYFEWSDTHPLNDAKSVTHLLFGDDSGTAGELYSLGFPALKTLSLLDFEELRSLPLSAFLPVAPTDPAFPSQALGLHILLDQVPLLCFSSGTNVRWKQVFASIDVRISEMLLALPDQVNPYRPSAWGDLKYPNIFVRQIMLHSGFIHSEHLQQHLTGQTLAEGFRQEAERHYQVKDPTRSLDDSDVTAFPKMILAGTPSDAKTAADGVFFMLRIMRVHEPIIHRYGRYPFWNSHFGRISTKDEEAWLEETANFGRCDKATEHAVREDVDSGRFTPLQGQ